MENQVLSWGDAITIAFQNFTNVVISVLPGVIISIIVLVLGVMLAVLLGRLVKHLVNMTKVDVLLNKVIKVEQLTKNGLEIKLSAILGWAVKWFFIIVTFIAVADILKFQQLTDFFKMVALYVPNVIIAILILLAGAVVGGWLKEVVIKAVTASSLPKTLAGRLGTVAGVSVIVFAIMASLNQLGIASDLINIMLTGFVAMIALAGGLAFGLGSKEHVKGWLDKMFKGL
jgi:hypothetical protein